MATYWRISSKKLGRGPLWENKQDAENERDSLLEEIPDDSIEIASVEMTEQEYQSLPEHEGY